MNGMKSIDANKTHKKDNVNVLLEADQFSSIIMAVDGLTIGALRYESSSLNKFFTNSLSRI